MKASVSLEDDVTDNKRMNAQMSFVHDVIILMA